MKQAKFGALEGVASIEAIEGLASKDQIASGGLDSRQYVIANYHPENAPDSIYINGYYSAGDGGQALYKKVASEPSHAGKFPITLSDGVTAVWYEIAETTLTPQMFGAKGDGVADDTAMVADALAAANSIGIGVHVPKGTYKISGPLTHDAPGPIFGDGENVTIFKVVGDGYDFLTLSSDYSGIKDLSIQSDVHRASGRSIVISEPTRKNYVRNVRAQNQFLAVAILADAVETLIDYVEILDATPTTGGGIYIDGGNDTFLNHVVIDSSGTQPRHGVRIQNTQAVWMTDCDIIHAEVPLLIDPTTGDRITWCFFNHCAFDSASSNGIEINVTGTGTCRGLFFSDCWSATNNRGVYITKDASATLSGIEFSDCKINNNSLQGALVAGGTGINFMGGTVLGNSLASIGTYAGIDFQANVTDFSVSGMTIGSSTGFGDNHSYGILIGTGCNEYRILGNNLTGNVTSGFADNSSATSTVRAVSDNLGASTERSGSVTLPSGATSVSVSHGLNGVPTSVIVTPQNFNLGSTSLWAGSFNGSGFNVNVGAAQGSDVTFSWIARIY